MTFTQARTKCNQYGSYLSYPRNDDDGIKLRGLLNEGRHASWIGADDIEKEGTWRNVKGEDLTYLPWSAGQPDNMRNQDCAWLGINRNTMKWDDRDCGNQLNYAVCHKSKITEGIKITSRK
ncbi:Oidioi.mRNA.OKI2018_I69.PAR.g9194.t1.cds [Oikopleura dioica]|uniref:Oidioi.mRNA.OKI2018_I69.PAR.g9194.t1.cds n=1 Tax=Oikopleura dioica TaxID=34765 RepID=A0ABN7RQA7_OIKDI|nr:Oidioi.mRNA.OKI2018_I69.PAR.g9194.t1.cds [Oikopleura dioica]